MKYRSFACATAGVLLVMVAGCRPSNTSTADAQVHLEFEPSPPVVGDVEVTLTLASPDGEPITDATVRLEGNMNHAGMKPSFADLEEVEPGKYAGTLNFTMGGDWFVLINAQTKDGRIVNQKIDVLGVQRP